MLAMPLCIYDPRLSVILRPCKLILPHRAVLENFYRVYDVGPSRIDSEDTISRTESILFLFVVRCNTLTSFDTREVHTNRNSVRIDRVRETLVLAFQTIYIEHAGPVLLRQVRKSAHVILCQVNCVTPFFLYLCCTSGYVRSRSTRSRKTRILVALQLTQSRPVAQHLALHREKMVERPSSKVLRLEQAE